MLLFNPPVLFLDEPTAGLDPLSVEILKEKIRRERNSGKLIIITSHIMSDLDELAGHVLYLQDGQLCYDNSIDTLKKVTGEDRLGKAMVKMINGLREGNAQGD